MADKCFFYSIAGFFGGLAIMYMGAREYLLIQKISNTPTSNVQSAAVGMVELYGKAKCIKPVQSPISKHKTPYWYIHAQYYVPGKYGGWKDICKLKSGSRFHLKDKTGSMLVEPKDAKIDIKPDHTYRGRIVDGKWSGDKTVDSQVTDFINSCEEKVIKRFSNNRRYKMKIEEYYIKEDDLIYILGSAEINEGKPSEIGHKNLILRKNRSDNVLYISDRPEKKIVEHKNNNYKLQIISGFILSLICMVYVLMHIPTG